MGSRQGERRTVAISGASGRRQETGSPQRLPARVLRRKQVGRLQELLARVSSRAERPVVRTDRALIAAEIEVLLEVWREEAMFKSRAIVAAKAARAHPQEGRVVRAAAMLAVPVKN